jgi:MarR family transcriptional regulator, negative regulator of the multidrug operon emrRAB
MLLVSGDANPRLVNLLASATLGVHDDATRALEAASGLSGSAAVALLALEEFLGGAPVSRLADVLGLTHSGGVRLVALLEREGLAVRRPGAGDRRQVEVRLTAAGRRRARTARAARDAVLSQTVAGLPDEDAERLEELLEQLVETRTRTRRHERADDQTPRAWWCRTCDFTACGRDQDRCPARSPDSLA